MKAYALELKVRAPILTGGTTMGGYGVDRTMLRDPENTPMLAGTHVTGKLKEALLQLLASQHAPFTAADVADWFGTMGGGEDDPRKIVVIGDLVATATEPETDAAGERLLDRARDGVDTRTRIAVDPVAGAASEGALLIEEMPFPAGAEVTFTGRVHVLAGDVVADRIVDDLRRGLHWLRQVGSERTVGYGRVLETAVTTLEPRQPLVVAPHGSRHEAGRWLIGLAFTEPFCVARPRRDRNLFESREVVPGGVVKGALARQLTHLLRAPGTARSALAKITGTNYAQLRKHFDALRLTHLFPVQDEGLAPDVWDDQDLERRLADKVRPAHPGLSVVRVEAQDEPEDWQLLDDPPPGVRAAFQDELKRTERDAVQCGFGWAVGKYGVARELRVRTAIDPKVRAAATNMLFAYEMIRPERHLWLGHLDLDAVPAADRALVVQDLADLVRDGLTGIGKTLATARVVLAPALQPRPGANPPDRRGLHTLVLESPALLCTPGDLRRTAADPDGATALLEGYRATLAELSGGALGLRRYFATQELSGGEHYERRFGRGRGYEPYVLTSPGSTFVLEPKDAAAAQKVLERWHRRGLGLAMRIRRHLGLDETAPEAALFADCPFLPENGYGEVRVDGSLYGCRLRAPPRGRP